MSNAAKTLREISPKFRLQRLLQVAGFHRRRVVFDIDTVKRVAETLSQNVREINKAFIILLSADSVSEVP